MLTDADKKILLIMDKYTWLENLFEDLIRYRAAYDEKYNLRDLLLWFERLQGRVRIELKREEDKC